MVFGQAALIALLFGDKVASEKFHLSVDLGGNYAALPGLKNQQGVFGFYFGLGTYIKLNDQWALTPEFKPLSPRGAQNVPPLKDYSGVLSDVRYSISLNYIDVPVLLQYRPGQKWLFSTGPQISFLTNAKQLAEGNLADGSPVTVTQNMRSNFNPIYFSVPLEVGYRLSSARKGKGMNVKVRYNIGVSDIIANEAYGSSAGSTFQFFLSFPFIKPQQ